MWNPDWKSKDGFSRATAEEGVFEKKAICKRCKDGYVYEKDCDECHGAWKNSRRVPCPDCDGTGTSDERCQFCEDGLEGVPCDNRTAMDVNVDNRYIKHMVLCNACSGTGIVMPQSIGLPLVSEWRQCSNCIPKGYRGWLLCPNCNGDKVRRQKCNICEGSGRTSCGKCSGVKRVWVNCDAGCYEGKQRTTCPDCQGTKYRWVRQ